MTSSSPVHEIPDRPDLKKRGLAIAPEIAVGDGAMGFWKALEEAFPATRHQRSLGSLLTAVIS